MKAEIYRALVKVNVSADDAQAVADSINKRLDKRYALHAAQLTTKVGSADAKVELIKWTTGSISRRSA